MLKKITILLGLTGMSLNALAQPEWRQLPPNPTITGASGYDIAVEEGGVFYVVYNLFNSTTGYYDVYFDYYNAEDGWQNALIYPTTNNGTIGVKTIRDGSNIYALANTNNSTEVTLFQIGGQTAYQLLSYNFPNFSSTTNWDMYPGVSASELYFVYKYSSTHYLYEFDYNTQAWYGHGDPLLATGVVPTDVKVYVNQDSVFVAGKYTTTPADKIKFRGAQKGVWTWGNMSLPNGDVFAMNGPLADTVTGPDKFFLFGDQYNTLSILAKDNGTEKEIPVGMGTYGQGIPFLLDYDLQTDLATSSTRPYVITKASNLTDQNVVYGRDPVSGIWSQVTSSPFVANSTIADFKRIQTTPATERIMIGYMDLSATPDDYVFLLTNEPPVVSNPGDPISQVCANTSAYGLYNMVIDDTDGDYISFVGVTSTDNALINPSDVSVSVSNNGFNADVYADMITGDVVSAQSVTLTYSFTDGFDLIQHAVTYEIVPSPVVAWSDDTLTFCNNGDIVDLYDYVSVPGGDFSENETDFPGHYWDPSLVVFDPPNFFMDLHYSYTNGVCSASAYATIASWEAPTATIAVTPATNCFSNDGTASLDISGGTEPYAFVWNIGNYTDTDISNLSPGNIHADIVDANGCRLAADGIIENTGAGITGVVTPVSCYGAGDGAIDLTVSGLATPLVVLWSNGYSTQDVANLQPGTHEVWITDAAGCSVTQAFAVPEPDELRLDIYSNGTSCGTSEGVIYINYAVGGTAPYTYLWSDNSTADTLGNVPSGLYGLTLTDANGCAITATAGVYSFGGPYIYDPVITAANCGLADGSIEAYLVPAGNNTQLLWSTGDTTASISGLEPGTYTLEITNDENCSAYYSFDIVTKAPERQPLCVVTVDSTTSTNLLVWEKIGDLAIHHYNIYRETTVPGEFQWIDTVLNSNMSIFNDVVASPINRSWKYRITAVNDCGIESVPSIAHKTIHLTTIDLGNDDFKIVWNYYEGASYASYNIYRFTNSTGWEPIATTPASLPYFIDTPPNTVGLDYMVDIELAEDCTADFTKAQDFNSSRSNKDKGQFNAGNGTGDSNNGLIELHFGSGTVSLYPNPVSGESVFVALEAVPTADYTIVSITGQQVGAGSLSEGTTAIGLQELQSGIYIMHLFNNNEHTSLRFVVE
jgi:hypothetical protein